MILLANTLACRPNLTVPFEGDQGSGGYMYSVLPGGAGGTIGQNSGIYTAPNNYGSDTIQVNDSSGATAQAVIAILPPIGIVADIIQTQMNLDNGRVYYWDQKIFQPKDFNLYIIIEELACKPFANNSTWDGSGLGLVEIQSTNFQSTLSIDIKSRGMDAVLRKEEVLMALKSNYSEQQQEFNSMKIAELPVAFNNLSGLDGAAIPYRYNISVNIQYAMKKEISIPFFDTFEDVDIISDPQEEAFLILEDGGKIELEQGGYILL